MFLQESGRIDAIFSIKPGTPMGAKNMKNIFAVL